MPRLEIPRPDPATAHAGALAVVRAWAATADPVPPSLPDPPPVVAIDVFCEAGATERFVLLRLGLFVHTPPPVRVARLRLCIPTAGGSATYAPLPGAVQEGVEVRAGFAVERQVLASSAGGLSADLGDGRMIALPWPDAAKLPGALPAADARRRVTSGQA